MNKFEKLEALQNYETFEQELAMVNTPEEMQELFAKHGVELSLEEVRELVASVAKTNSDELSVEDLEDVAGGGLLAEVGKFVLDQVAKWFVKKGLDKLFKW